MLQGLLDRLFTTKTVLIFPSTSDHYLAKKSHMETVYVLGKVIWKTCFDCSASDQIATKKQENGGKKANHPAMKSTSVSGMQ